MIYSIGKFQRRFKINLSLSEMTTCCDLNNFSRKFIFLINSRPALRAFSSEKSFKKYINKILIGNFNYIGDFQLCIYDNRLKQLLFINHDIKIIFHAFRKMKNLMSFV